MIPFSSHGKMLALAAAAGCALGTPVFAQTAPSDQAVRDQTVHSDAPGRHLAPHDTFYTMEYASARTDKGVEGFPPGTEVHLVSVNREARTLTVTDGHANVELPPDKLTNDTDIAALVKAKDDANQARVAAFREAEMAAYQKYQKDVAEYTAKDLEKRQQAIRDADEKSQAQATNSRTEQPVASNNTGGNGYYDQGGLGYGSPYGYFIDVSGTSTNNRTAPGQSTTSTSSVSGKNGALPSSNGTIQSGNSRTGTTSTGGGSSGGKKP